MKELPNALISASELAATVKRLAGEIDRDCQGHSLVLVGILKGCFVFLADLIRQMDTPIDNVEFIRLSSYGSSTVSSGEAALTLGLSGDAIGDRHAILIEDIVDTGITTATALDYLKGFRPASLKLCALLDKPSRRQVPVTIDYLGQVVPDRFIVGYGIDFDQKYRQLPAIYVLDT